VVVLVLALGGFAEVVAAEVVEVVVVVGSLWTLLVTDEVLAVLLLEGEVEIGILMVSFPPAGNPGLVGMSCLGGPVPLPPPLLLLVLVLSPPDGFLRMKPTGGFFNGGSGNFGDVVDEGGLITTVGLAASGVSPPLSLFFCNH